MKKIGLVFLVTLMGLSGFWITQHLVWQTHYEKERAHPEVARNSRYAATKLLIKRNRSVIEANDRAAIQHLPTTGVLFLEDGWGYLLEEKDQEQLLNWVRNGGHLILPINYSGAKLYQRLGVEQQTTPASKRNERPNSIEREKYQCLASALIINDAAIGQEIWISDQYGNPVPLSKVGKKEARWLIDQPYGKGFVTTLAFETWIFSNADIGEFDHAILLNRLATLHYPQAPVIFNTALDDPSLFGWMIKNAPLVLASLFLCLLMWLWYVIPRFGTIKSGEDMVRRSLQEHLLATGFYLWKVKSFQPMHQAVTDRVNAKIQRKYPDFFYLPTEKKWAYLASKTGIASEQIQTAFETLPHNKKTLIRSMTLLQQVYRSL